MSKGSGKSIALAVVAAVVALIASCSSQASAWYPSGSATVASSYELTGSSDKSCVATIKITNTGSSKISTSTVSVKATTDARSYIKTATSSVVVLPGSSMYLDVSLTYATALESLKSSGLVVTDQYYQ